MPDLPRKIAEFADEMSRVSAYPLPGWQALRSGAALAEFPAAEVILETLRAIEGAPWQGPQGTFATDHFLSPVILGATRKKGIWDLESARQVLSQLTRMADRLHESIITASAPYPAHVVVNSMDRSDLDKAALSDLATELIERYRTIAVDRFNKDSALLAQHPEFAATEACLDEAELEAAGRRIADYPEQSFDSDIRKMLGVLRSWCPGTVEWELDDWGKQAIPLLADPPSDRGFELTLLRLYPRHSGCFEWATTSPRPGAGAFVGPNNLRRLLQSVAALDPPRDDEEAQVLGDVLLSAWESIEGAGKRSLKLGNRCLKALANRKDILRELLPQVGSGQAARQIKELLDSGP